MKRPKLGKPFLPMIPNRAKWNPWHCQFLKIQKQKLTIRFLKVILRLFFFLAGGNSESCQPLIKLCFRANIYFRNLVLRQDCFIILSLKQEGHNTTWKEGKMLRNANLIENLTSSYLHHRFRPKNCKGYFFSHQGWIKEKFQFAQNPFVSYPVGVIT